MKEDTLLNYFEGLQMAYTYIMCYQQAKIQDSNYQTTNMFHQTATSTRHLYNIYTLTPQLKTFNLIFKL